MAKEQENGHYSAEVTGHYLRSQFAKLQKRLGDRPKWLVPVMVNGKTAELDNRRRMRRITRNGK